MSSEEETVRFLAEEVRAAVLRAGSGRLAAPEPPRDPSLAGIRQSLAKAGAYLTPSVPGGARLEPVKRALVRGFRFLWRGQSSFNTLALEAGAAVVEEMERERARLRQQIAGLEQRTERAEALAVELEQRVATWDGRFSALESAAAGGSPAARPLSSSLQASSNVIPPGVYGAFEERFRGTADDIRDRQRDYVLSLRGAPGPVLDVGCGRGELLRLLAEEGIAGTGIESNPIAVAACREQGLSVDQGDALRLVSGKAPGSLGAIVALQVVEHWSPGDVFAFLVAARRALAPGGRILLESVNTDSLSALRAFFLDPTHVRPVPPEALRFLVEAVGFAGARIQYRAALPDAERLSENTENDAKLNRLLFAPQDYALTASVPDPLDAGSGAPANR